MSDQKATKEKVDSAGTQLFVHLYSGKQKHKNYSLRSFHQLKELHSFKIYEFIIKFLYEKSF